MGSVSFFQIIVMFLLPFLSVMLPILAGQYFGIRTRKINEEVNDSPIGSVVGAALGLLVFMLAFTFQIVDSRYGSRKELLLEEVTTIRTTYLQAGLIPEPFRTASRKLLIEYTDLRIILARDASLSRLENLKSRSQSILDSLWSYSEALAARDRSSEAYSLYTASVNNLVENYNKRITLTFEYRIPGAILWVLFIITLFSMFLLGYQFGISGRKNSTLAVFTAIIFSSVMFLILALDRPETGIMKLNQAPINTLARQLRDR